MFQVSSEFEHLLSPIKSENFFRDFWEQEPLAIHRRRADYYGDLCSLDGLEETLAFSRPRFAYPESAATSTYIRGLPADSPAAAAGAPLGVAQVRQAFDGGKSVVVMGMEKRRPAVAELCRGLEATFGCPVHGNLYLTPSNSQGFAPHFDAHEVFVLQLEGVKHWRLLGAGCDLPLASDAADRQRRPFDEPREVRLEAGDLLYIPRGHVHEAFASEHASLHLTIGVNVYRWVDLFHRALTLAARRDVRLRKSLPGGALLEAEPDAREQFAQLCESLIESMTSKEVFEQALRSLGDEFFGSLPMLPCRQFAALNDLDSLDLDSLWQKHPQAICRVVENDWESAIEFPGNRVAGPKRIGPAIRFIAAATQFTARDLPGELNDEGKRVLVRRLCREGLLKPVGECTGQSRPQAACNGEARALTGAAEQTNGRHAMHWPSENGEKANA